MLAQLMSCSIFYTLSLLHCVSYLPMKDSFNYACSPSQSSYKYNDSIAMRQNASRVKGVSAYELHHMTPIIIDYFSRIEAHTCWQLDELIKAGSSWTINLGHVNRFQIDGVRKISIYYMLAILDINQNWFHCALLIFDSLV